MNAMSINSAISVNLISSQITGSPVGGVGANKENSNYSWTMTILNKLPGAQKRKNKKNKKGSGSADGRPGNGNIVRNEFLFPAERRSKGSYSQRPDSVVEEEITLKTLNRLSLEDTETSDYSDVSSFLEEDEVELFCEEEMPEASQYLALSNIPEKKECQLATGATQPSQMLQIRLSPMHKKVYRGQRENDLMEDCWLKSSLSRLDNLCRISNEISDIIGMIRNQNSLKWTFSADILQRIPPEEDKFRFTYYQFIRNLSNKSHRKDLVEQFCKKFHGVVGESENYFNFQEQLSTFWGTIHGFIEETCLEDTLESYIKLAKKMIIVLENTFEKIQVGVVLDGILKSLATKRSRDDLKSMFPRNVTYTLTETDDPGRYAYFKFVRYFSENHSEKVASYFCKKLHRIINKGYKIYDIHVFLVTLWTRMHCTIADLQNAEATGIIDKQVASAQIEEILGDTLDEHYRYFSLNQYECFLCRELPSRLIERYYCHVFQKSKFWRKTCAKRFPETSCYTACFVFNAAFQFIVIAVVVIGFGTLIIYLASLFY